MSATFYQATLDTRNFGFEAYGHTEQEARDALISGLRQHARTHDIPLDWFDEAEIEVRPFTFGEAYRDRERIRP
jgi:hypothetical protein